MIISAQNALEMQTEWIIINSDCKITSSKKLYCFKIQKSKLEASFKVRPKRIFNKPTVTKVQLRVDRKLSFYVIEKKPLQQVSYPTVRYVAPFVIVPFLQGKSAAKLWLTWGLGHASYCCPCPSHILLPLCWVVAPLSPRTLAVSRVLDNEI